MAHDDVPTLQEIERLCQREQPAPEVLTFLGLTIPEIARLKASFETVSGKTVTEFWEAAFLAGLKSVLFACPLEKVGEALRWYASEEAYETEGLPGDTVYDRMRRKERVMLDRGQRARAALSKLYGKE